MPNPKDLADFANMPKPMDLPLFVLFAIANVSKRIFIHNGKSSAFSHQQCPFPASVFYCRSGPRMY